MTRYIIRRLLQAIPLLLLITFILFILLRTMGDPLAAYGGRRRMRPEDRARLRVELGLDKPIYVQYGVWLKDMATGNWGLSVDTHEPVTKMIGERLPNTLLLMVITEVVILVFSLVLGIYSALRQYSLMDQAFTAFSFIGYSMPIFWLALMLIYLFAVRFKAWGLPYLPTGGVYTLSLVELGKKPSSFLGITYATIPDLLKHLALPVIAMSTISIAGYSRYVRSTMLAVINEDYIRTARAKGLPERLILLRHALKNASLPLVTLIGLDLPFLLGGAIVTESIFSWPGMGRLFWNQVSKGDYPVVMAILLIISVAVINEDYIRTARAKGLAERVILLRHALKNASLPLVTLIGLDLPFLLGGAIVTESIFSWPGMGRLFWNQVSKGDYPVVMAILLIISVAVIVFQLFTDIAYTALDPRIRYE